MTEINRLVKELEVENEEAGVRRIYALRQQLGLTAVMELCRVSDVTLRLWFKKYNLPLARHGGGYRGKDITITEEEYRNGTYKQLAKERGVSTGTIYRRIKKFARKKERQSS